VIRPGEGVRTIRTGYCSFFHSSRPAMPVDQSHAVGLGQVNR
jgi:hypothetical protein